MRHALSAIVILAAAMAAACTDREAELRGHIGQTACQAATNAPLGTIVDVDRNPSGPGIAYVLERDGKRFKFPPSMVTPTPGECPPYKPPTGPEAPSG
jgi:hypothetical protein